MNRLDEIKDMPFKEEISNKTPATKRLKKFVKSAAVLLGSAALLTAAAPGAVAAPLDTVESLFSGDSQALQIIALLTLITLVPTLLIMLTGFTRIVITLSIVRNAIGLQNMPPNTVLVGLALFITYFVMSPVLGQIQEVAYDPYIRNEIKLEEAVDQSMVPLREFMYTQTYETDLDFFAGLAGMERGVELEELPHRVVIAAFVTSELKHAFAIGFFIYVPFIVIDMIVASTLMAMGMMMLPPAMISMPFKILLFVLVDGWQLTIGAIISSFGA